MFKDVIVSAPFGNWINNKNVTSTVGTFTYNYRGGLFYRMWRCLRTLRYNWRSQAWINKLGLPNPGLISLPAGDRLNKIISIYGFNRDEWNGLSLMLIGNYQPPLAVELNLSCPNVNHSAFLADIISAIDRLTSNGINIIAKLPPVRWMDLAKPLYDYGIRIFHCCNTIPTPGGGLSGKPLKQYSLWAIDDLRQRYANDIRIIGGGGITSINDVVDYRTAGADHVSVGSMLLNPFRLMRFGYFLEDVQNLSDTNFKWRK